MTHKKSEPTLSADWEVEVKLKMCLHHGRDANHLALARPVSKYLFEPYEMAICFSWEMYER